MTSVREIFDTMEYGPAPEGDKPAREWLARFDGKKWDLFTEAMSN